MAEPKNGTSLFTFIETLENGSRIPLSSLRGILRALTESAKTMHFDINRAGLIGITGAAGSENVQGEEQQKLDIIANDRFIKSLNDSKEICLIASEEDDDVVLTETPEADYTLAIDPLDGSSNIDVNVSIGTIFSVFKRLSANTETPTAADVMQKGTEQVLAGYVLYGSSTMLVFTTGSGVHAFTYDQATGEFLLSAYELQIPKDGKVYSCNEGGLLSFDEHVRDYLHSCKERGFKARYIGSLVADFHRNMLKGGVFLYPATAKNPNGKLRLLYECNPLSWVAEVAGGASHNASERILEILPQELHQRVPLIIGSENMAGELIKE